MDRGRNAKGGQDGGIPTRPVLRRLERPLPLSEQAYERIREELVSGGRLARAERLVEREVARELSMSRTPVRDALQRLAAEGLIGPLTSGGYGRRQLTMRDVRECFELRLVLEPVAAGLAARARAETASRSGTDPEPPATAQFHAWVAEQSGNDVLAHALRAVSARLLVAEPSGAVDDARVEHDSIADAIRRGDAEAASAEMTAHLRSQFEGWQREMRTRAGP